MKLLNKWIEGSKVYKELLHAAFRMQEQRQIAEEANAYLKSQLEKADNHRSLQSRVIVDLICELSYHRQKTKGKREHKAKR